jgi:hypothetical protein
MAVLSMVDALLRRARFNAPPGQVAIGPDAE